ncbi:MAG: nucleotidyltransferase [Eubacterium sp.]
MKVLGIIAEYNPFHNGHKYQIKKAREISGADFVVVIMSGNFVQRGAPAIIDKHIRTKMALENGADLVIELPVIYSCASAEFFASGAVSILNELGIIDYLCFGTETDDLDTLSVIADILINEPEKYSISLKEALKNGFSYPLAREMALNNYIHESMSVKITDITQIISEPNNILAIEYLKSLKKLNSSIKPIGIKRIGSGYHSTHIDNSMSSATAIRKSINNFQLSEIQHCMPSSAYSLLSDNKEYFVHENDFSLLLGAKINTLSPDELSNYQDVSKELADRIYKNKKNYISFEQYKYLLCTRNYTSTRISRALLHIALGIGRTVPYDCNDLYVRILGFNKKASSLLSGIKQNGNIPIISKMADAGNILENASLNSFNVTTNSDNLYRMIVMNKTNQYIPNEFERPIINF